MIHIDPALVVDLLGDTLGRPASHPLFPTPVVTDVTLARRLRLLYNVLTGPSTPLEQHEHLASTVRLLAGHASRRPAEAARPPRP